MQVKVERTAGPLYMTLSCACTFGLCLLQMQVKVENTAGPHDLTNACILGLCLDHKVHTPQES